MAASPSDFGDQQEQNGEFGNVENEDLESGLNDNQQQQQQQQQQHHQQQLVGMDENMSNKGQKIKHETAADLFEDVAQRTKMLIIQMAQNFRESEEFESLCLGNVEKLLMDAQALEDNLRHQKELLQQRLLIIGSRLATAEDQ